MVLSSFLEQGKSVVEGHVNEMLGLGKDISKVRMSICRTCPLYKLKDLGIGKTPVCNRNLWINPKNDDISTFEKEGFIRGCGCRLEAKTTLSYEKCIAGKW